MRALHMSAIAAACAVTIAALMGVAAPSVTKELSLGVTKESSVAGTCAHATWPDIPADCLVGASPRPVRMISSEHLQADKMAFRFTTAFE